MSFISISFAFYFLPVCFLLYWVMPGKAKPVFLLAAGIIFYSWGSPQNMLLLICVTLINWLYSFRVKNNSIYLSGILFNVFTLAFFKYVNTGMGLPLGISFYIFHAVSFLTDIHSGRAKASKNPLTFALYLTLFTKITMGPIVKYADFEPQLKNLHNPSPEDAASGVIKFAVGFAKKAVLAGSLAAIVADAWADAPNSTLSAWIGILGFTFQLYFDFSGYSDMATGLSRMLGLEIQENFRYPYLSTSVSEFWRRWHISLGSWLRDYIYIPLGGNRAGRARVYVNLLAVWLVTGIWHGSGLNFVVWGLWYYLFICIEKLAAARLKEWRLADDGSAWYRFACRYKRPAVIGWAYTFAVCVLGWVMFNSANLADSRTYMTYLFGGAADIDVTLAHMLLHDNRIVIAAALLGATPVPKEIARRLFDGLPEWFVTLAKIILIAALMYISVTRILAEGYSPFIYTEF